MKSSRRRTSMVPGGGPLFQRMFTRLGCDGRPPRFRVEFYPYSSLVLTIRRREEVVYVRFSDLLRRAPLAVLEGAAAQLHESHAPRTGSPGGHRTPRRTLRSGRTFRSAQWKILCRPVAAPAHRMEHPELAAAIWLLRSRAESDFAQSSDGSSRRSGVRRGVCLVSRDAARQAPHSPLRLYHGLPFKGISRRREALPRIRTRSPHPGPAG